MNQLFMLLLILYSGKTQFGIMANTAHKTYTGEAQSTYFDNHAADTCRQYGTDDNQIFGCIKLTFASINVLMPKGRLFEQQQHKPPLTGIGIETKTR